MTGPIRPEDEAADAAAERALRLNARVVDEVLARRPLAPHRGPHRAARRQ